MKILFLGDIVAEPGRNIVKEILPSLKKDRDIDFVIASADNLTEGRGATRETINELLVSGVDYFTGGDHIFDHKEFEEDIEDLPVVRAANYPGDTPGEGYKLVDCGPKGSILIINLLGRTSFGDSSIILEDPFRVADSILEEFSDRNDVVTFIDFHAEATSEKNALGFYLDGKVDALVGTHTHIPTCDTRVLPLGTMYVTDVGMCGNIDSVLGVRSSIIIDSFMNVRKQRFEWESTGTKAFRSVSLDTDSNQIIRLDYLK